MVEAVPPMPACPAPTVPPAAALIPEAEPGTEPAPPAEAVGVALTLPPAPPPGAP
jgi:hypothetical protein